MITTVFWTYWEAKVDANHFSRKQYFKNHTDRWFNRFSTILSIAIFDIVLAIMSGFLFYLLFDIILNLQRDFDWDYVGSESNSDKIIGTKKRFLFKTILTFVVVIAVAVLRLIIYMKWGM